MIYIIKGQANTVVLTLDEKATTSTHDWLFEFINDVTGDIKLFTGFDISSTKTRFNKFIITESLTENVYNSTISLESGYWSYTVYEMAQTSPVSLIKSSALATVETGKAWVYDSTANGKTVFIGDGNTKDSKTFKG